VTLVILLETNELESLLVEVKTKLEPKLEVVSGLEKPLLVESKLVVDELIEL